MIDTHVPAWQTEGTCASIGPIFLDLPEGRQVTICADCPVQHPCLEYGIAQEPATHSSTVTYGGLTPRKLVAECRRRHGDDYTLLQCARCGLEFHTSQHNARYCSRHCQQAAARDRWIGDSIARTCASVGQVAS